MTSITTCDQIIRSTSADGLVEFVIFFMRGAYAWPGEAVCLQSLHSELSWPETWQLMEFSACGGANGGLDPGGTTHALDLSWSATYGVGEVPHGVLPVARLVMNVVGPGRLGIVYLYSQEVVVLRHNCYGKPFVTYPVQIYAEAGMSCG